MGRTLRLECVSQKNCRTTLRQKGSRSARRRFAATFFADSSSAISREGVSWIVSAGVEKAAGNGESGVGGQKVFGGGGVGGKQSLSDLTRLNGEKLHSGG